MPAACGVRRSDVPCPPMVLRRSTTEVERMVKKVISMPRCRITTKRSGVVHWLPIVVAERLFVHIAKQGGMARRGSAQKRPKVLNPVCVNVAVHVGFYGCHSPVINRNDLTNASVGQLTGLPHFSGIVPHMPESCPASQRNRAPLRTELAARRNEMMETK
jgi:hypothetical protein